MPERLVDPNDGRDVRGLEPARQIGDRFHVERPMFVVDRAVIKACRLDDPGNAARGEFLEPGAQRRSSFAHCPPYAVFFHDPVPPGWFIPPLPTSLVLLPPTGS